MHSHATKELKFGGREEKNKEKSVEEKKIELRISHSHAKKN
jgi:hypothetical protein